MLNVFCPPEKSLTFGIFFSSARKAVFERKNRVEHELDPAFPGTVVPLCGGNLLLRVPVAAPARCGRGARPGRGAADTPARTPPPPPPPPPPRPPPRRRRAPRPTPWRCIRPNGRSAPTS